MELRWKSLCRRPSTRLSKVEAVLYHFDRVKASEAAVIGAIQAVLDG